MKFFANKNGKEDYLENWKWVGLIFAIWLIVRSVSIIAEKEASIDSYINTNNSTTVNTTTSVTPKTKVEESRYNNLAPSEYYKEMKSDSLEYADIAWQASKTYGWNCSEVTNLSDKV